MVLDQIIMDRILQEVRNIFDPAPTYVVGGAVRNQLLGIPSPDVDISTPLLPDEIESFIHAAGRKVNPIGKRYGTIITTVDSGVPGAKFVPVEITTFRSEKYTEGCRKPDVVFVRDITHDLSRRDFTMNAMAISPKGKLIDPFGGQADIEAKAIRYVGTATTRIKEDPLRMLRLARFASQLGFSPDTQAFDRTKLHAHKILQVSRERWAAELDKLLVGDHVGHGLELLWLTRLMNYIIPELAIQFNYDQNNPHHDFSLHEHTVKVVEAVPAEKNIRWAALLHDVGKPFTRTERPDRSNFIHHDEVGAELVRSIAARLKWSKEQTEIVHNLVLNHLVDDSPLKEADTGGSKVAIV
jgi:tRNA nucleotidyltransferase (CCA-adding enzyme)